MKKNILHKLQILLLFLLVIFYFISTIIGGITIFHFIFNISYPIAAILWIIVSVCALPIVIFIDNKTS